jgi:hypothetical protein
MPYHSRIVPKELNQIDNSPLKKYNLSGKKRRKIHMT